MHRLTDFRGIWTKGYMHRLMGVCRGIRVNLPKYGVCDQIFAILDDTRKNLPKRIRLPPIVMNPCSGLPGGSRAAKSVETRPVPALRIHSPEPAPFLRTKPAKSCCKSVKSEGKTLRNRGMCHHHATGRRTREVRTTKRGRNDYVFSE